MTEKLDKDYLQSLDRRVSEHDTKIANNQRDYTEMSHEIKELLNRLNNGLSPSVNEVRKDNAEIKLLIERFSHQMKIDQIEFRNMVRESTEHTRLMVTNSEVATSKALKSFEADKLEPVVREVGYIKKTFVYGLVGALTVVLGQKLINVVWDKIFPKDTIANVSTR